MSGLWGSEKTSEFDALDRLTTEYSKFSIAAKQFQPLLVDKVKGEIDELAGKLGAHMTYEEKLQRTTEALLIRNGSFDSAEVLNELTVRGWNGKLDSVLDIHKQLTELLGPARQE